MTGFVEPRAAKAGVFRGRSDFVGALGLVRDHGLVAAFLRIRSIALHRLHSAWLERALVPLDVAETDGEIPLSSITTVGVNRQQGVAYVPTPSRVFQRLLGELPIEPDRFAFIDLGCGKGRLLTLAAEHGFQRVRGIEFAVELAEEARARIAQYMERSGTPAEILCRTMDAADFVAPDGPLVVYLFNPFGEPVLETVIRNLERALQRSPRKIYVIYYNPAHGDLFARSAHFQPRALTPMTRLYLAALSPYGAAVYESRP